jgi:hypothetical protein
MYLQNKYTTWYNKIIDRASTRLLTTYYERHHIIPKSLGGTDLKENIAELTAHEHYVCHKLLTKMVSGDARHKMNLAAYRMSHSSKYHDRHKISGAEYARLKENFAKSLSELKKGKPGIPRSIETRAKMSKSRTGKSMPAETRQKISTSSVGKTHSEETKAKFKNRTSSRKGVVLSDETKLKMSLAKKGRTFSPEHMANLRIAKKISQKTPI